MTVPTPTPIPYDLIAIPASPGQITMEQVLAGYQEQFLMKMLIFSVLYLITVIVLFVYVDRMEQNPIKRRILRIFTYFNLAPALYYPILMFGIYTGWYQ